jgi:hypothetical protein
MSDLAIINSANQLALVTAWFASDETAGDHTGTQSKMWIKSADYAGFPGSGADNITGCVVINFAKKSYEYDDCSKQYNFLCGAGDVFEPSNSCFITTTTEPTTTPQGQDADEAANGPNGEGCKNGGAVVDVVDYDKMFTCDCSGIPFEGDNCEQQVTTEPTTTPTEQTEPTTTPVLTPHVQTQTNAASTVAPADNGSGSGSGLVNEWDTKAAALATASEDCTAFQVAAEAGSGSGTRARRGGHQTCADAQALYDGAAAACSPAARARRGGHVGNTEESYCAKLNAAKAMADAKMAETTEAPGSGTTAAPSDSSAAAMSFTGLASVVAYIM